MIKFDNSRLCFVAAMMFLVAFSSCRSKMVGVKGVANKQEVSALFVNVPRFDTFRSQVQIETNGLNAKGDLRIIKNKAIFFSVQAFLGIEVARLKITPDSIIAIDRLHRRYFADTFAHIYGLRTQGVNYFTIQALFSNALFLQNRDTLSLNDADAFRWEQKGDQIRLTSRKDEFSRFTLNSNRQLQLTELGDASDRLKLNWAYSDFAKFFNSDFPQTMQVDVVSPKRKIGITMKMAKVEIGRSFAVDAAVPLRYAKVDLDEILKILSE